MVEGPPHREGLDVWEHMARAKILNIGYIGSSAYPTPAAGSCSAKSIALAQIITLLATKLLADSFTYTEITKPDR